MKNFTKAFLFLLLLLCLFSCRQESPAVPKPEAWPRVEIYPPSLSPLNPSPLYFLVNDSTVALPTDNPLWVTLLYPRYDASLFITFTPVTDADRASVIDNRVERMALNAGPAQSTLTELTSSGGFNSRLMITPRGSLTPVQFIAVSDRWVVSGAVGFSKVNNPDSLMPIVNALENDILEALKHLKTK